MCEALDSILNTSSPPQKIYNPSLIIRKISAWHWRLMPVILATQEAEIGRITV
jgi:hypothetical protein